MGGDHSGWRGQIIGSKARTRETKETSASPLVMQPHLCNSVKANFLMRERIIGLDSQTIPTWEQTIYSNLRRTVDVRANLYRGKYIREVR